MDHLLEYYRNQLGVSKEEEELLIEELKKTNPVSHLQAENDQLKKRVEESENAILVLMDIQLMGGM